VHADDADPTRIAGSGKSRPDDAHTLGRERRLRRPQEFAAVLAADRAHSMRAAGKWLSMTASWNPVLPGSVRLGSVRLGITVSKRMARRAIDRALVKRIAREAFRHAAPGIERVAANSGVGVDISVRLKRPVALPDDPQRPALTPWRRALRTEADELLASVTSRIALANAHA
jgi:ribonuclease P protein component